MNSGTKACRHIPLHLQLSPQHSRKCCQKLVWLTALIFVYCVFLLLSWCSPALVKIKCCPPKESQGSHQEEPAWWWWWRSSSWRVGLGTGRRAYSISNPSSARNLTENDFGPVLIVSPGCVRMQWGRDHVRHSGLLGGKERQDKQGTK